MFASLILTFAAQPQFKVAGIFTDHMVLQRDRSVPIWGWAQPGSTVKVEGSWGGVGTATADKDGRWEARVKTAGAGGPYTLSISSDAGQAKFEDVLLGEVWLCGGQSNMEWPVGNVGYNPPIEGAEEEVAGANFPKIRLLQVARTGSPTPVLDLPLAWQVCSPQTVPTFSASGYLFGKNLFQALNVPIGLISSNVGGTEVELWMSDAAMHGVPSLANRMKQVDETAAKYQVGLKRWQAESTAGDSLALMGAEKGSGWTPIDGAKAYEAIGLGAFDGVVWYRAEFNLDSVPSNAMLELGSIDDNDRTFVNGEWVGETAGWNVKREYKLNPGVLRSGRNVVVVKSIDGAGLGGFTSNFVPVVKVDEATIPITNWSYQQGRKISEFPPMPPAPPTHSTLYNAMIYPLKPYAIRGAVWYQGEANVGRGFQYRESFPAMIENWRSDFRNPGMPFYFVQIAPFSPYGPGNAAAELRESQFLTLRTKNTGMVVATDITPDVTNIHPPKKREIGERLARWALAKTYHQSVGYSGPLYSGVTFENGKARLSFEYSLGLNAKSDLAGFIIAGPDKIFKPAQARIDGHTVVVWSDEVRNPAAVRYGWNSAPIGTLFNSYGLPASPFRTDRWRAETEGASW
jgi:sialate O-acetylesterase